MTRTVCDCCNRSTDTYYIRSRDEYLCDECIDDLFVEEENEEA